MVLLAVSGAPRGVAAVQGGGLGGCDLDRQPADRVGRNAGDRCRPFRRLGHAVAAAHQIGFVGRALGRSGRQVPLIEP